MHRDLFDGLSNLEELNIGATKPACMRTYSTV